MTATTEPTRRREETRRRLVHAAIDEFSRRGVDATSVEHLCQAAGFTRGAFYSNFATKDDLCVEVMRFVSDEQVRQHSEALAGAAADLGSDELITAILSASESDPKVLRTLMEIELRAYRDPEFRERIEAVRSEVWPRYVDLVTRAAEHAGLDFLADVEELLLITEAIWHYPRTAGSDQPDLRNRLVTTVARLVTKEKS